MVVLENVWIEYFLSALRGLNVLSFFQERCCLLGCSSV